MPSRRSWSRNECAKTNPSEDRSEERARTGARESRAMSQGPTAEAMKDFNNSIVDEFRANGGKVGGPFEGATLLLLTTTGAKSGQPRLAPLACFTVDGKLIIIGSKASADTNPDWVHNLRANPQAHIEVGTDAYDVTAREL